MPGNFWFEIRGTEKYRAHIYAPYPKTGSKTIEYTEEEYTLYRAKLYQPIYIDLKEYAKHKKFVEQREKQDRKYGVVKERKETTREFPLSFISLISIYVYRDKENLQRVDELICLFMGEPKPSIEQDSYFYFMCHEAGFWSTSHADEENMGRVDKKSIEWIMTKAIRWDSVFENDRFKDWPQDMVKAKFEALFDWVFLKKWEYHATG
jgi:hypothetical protein